MEPLRTAVRTLGGDAAETSREALDPAVAPAKRRARHHPAARTAALGGDPSSIAAREASPSGGFDRTAAAFRRCAAVNSSMLETQSRNCIRSMHQLATAQRQKRLL